VYGSEKQLIDHMLASPNAGVRLDTDSAVILHNATAASDHHPMAATYTVP
jgi:endonuclease/exonuclease/phosphatase family metal-dependent hydrolase